MARGGHVEDGKARFAVLQRVEDGRHEIARVQRPRLARLQVDLYAVGLLHPGDAALQRGQVVIVRGGGRKPWRQKGTGRARQGSTRSPQWTGGGVVFAPKPRDYSFKLNKKVKRLALKSALTTKVNDGKFVVVDEINLPEMKTKEMVKVLNNLNVNKSLVVLEDANEKAVVAARNIPTVKTASVSTINVYDILKYDSVVVTKAAVEKIEEVYA